MAITYGDIIYSSLPYLQLDIDFPSKEMLAEAQNLVDQFVPHRENEEGTRGWRALVLHGLGEHMSLGYESYGITEAEQFLHYRWTKSATLCPVTTNFFQVLFPANKYGRIRFMMLQPGGSVPFHVDYTQSKLASINMALSHHEKCHFYYRIGNDTKEVPFKPGTAFALNLSYEHSVVNESDEDRYHIIVHTLKNTPAYKNMIIRSYNKVLGINA